VKTGCNLAESSKESCGSKRIGFPMMIMMMMMMMFDTLTAVPMKNAVFWDVTPCRLLISYFSVIMLQVPAYSYHRLKILHVKVRY
jgi:hypothetical protein